MAGRPEDFHMTDVSNPSFIDPRIDSRSISFENPTGARGAGGQAAGGRKGAPFAVLEPGERRIVANIEGPGTVRHIWMAAGASSPTVLRALRWEVFYDDLPEPSVSVPLLDFFGHPHGRLAEFVSQMLTGQIGRGLNSHIPMPFGRSIRIELTNESDRHFTLFFQLDYTLEPDRNGNDSYLHATFRRENPTTLQRDFVIATGLRGPGRFLGCVVGVRTIDPGDWYGEGEVKIYRDGDREFPTYCGTGLEDYIGAAWGMQTHWTPYSGVPLILSPDDPDESTFVTFYRWHIPDPIMFSDELTVTIQQIGDGPSFTTGQEEQLATALEKRPAAPYWMPDVKFTPDALGFALGERIDDYCATAFVYCRNPQPVPRYETDVATADIDWTTKDRPPASAIDDDAAEAISVAVGRGFGALT
jgi:hypothetical protein